MPNLVLKNEKKKKSAKSRVRAGKKSVKSFKCGGNTISCCKIRLKSILDMVQFLKFFEILSPVLNLTIVLSSPYDPMNWLIELVKKFGCENLMRCI